MTSIRTPSPLIALVVCLFWAGTPAEAQIFGVVLDADTEDPIVGARVTLQATDIRVLTDADGEFDFPDLEGDDLVIVAAMKGYFNGGLLMSSPDTDGEILLEAVPPDDAADYDFVNPVVCGFCHPDQKDEWDVSRMAGTGLNTWVYDVYDGSGTSGGDGGFVYTEDSILAKEDPESDCASCHQPVRWLEEGGGVALGELDDPSGAMLAGVSCDFCHKVADIDESQIFMPGLVGDYVTITRPVGDSPEQVQYGLLGDVDFVDTTDMRASWQPQLVDALCGICHEEQTDPDRDGDYDDEEAVPIQSTYSEWKDSSYGDPESDDYRSCASCHMPAHEEEELPMCSVLTPGILRPGETVRRHEFDGTSAEYLENAVSMDVTTEVVDGELVVTVAIENDSTGHHVPSGIPLRHMILLVEVDLDGSGDLEYVGEQVVDESGGVGTPLEGYYEGLPGKVFAKILEDDAGNLRVFYTEATGIHADTRIPAGETDTTVYPFALDTEERTGTVRARLIYRRAFREWIDAKGWSREGLGDTLMDLEEPHYGFLMEESEVDVVLPPRPAPEFVRGDLNGDDQVAVEDGIAILQYLFLEAPSACVAAADLDDRDGVLLNDPILLFSYIFSEGDPPAAPFPDCGSDEDTTLRCDGPVENCD